MIDNNHTKKYATVRQFHREHKRITHGKLSLSKLSCYFSECDVKHDVIMLV